MRVWSLAGRQSRGNWNACARLCASCLKGREGMVAVFGMKDNVSLGECDKDYRTCSGKIHL